MDGFDAAIASLVLFVVALLDRGGCVAVGLRAIPPAVY
jgi:hypothetical protein